MLLRAPLINGVRSGPPHLLSPMNHRTGTPPANSILCYLLFQRPSVVQTKQNPTKLLPKGNNNTVNE